MGATLHGRHPSHCCIVMSAQSHRCHWPNPRSPESDSPTLLTQENPRSSHRLGIETLRNRGAERLTTVMTEEDAGFSRWWFAGSGGHSLILSSQFSIPNYRRGGAAGVIGVWCPRFGSGGRDSKCRAEARRSQDRPSRCRAGGPRFPLRDRVEHGRQSGDEKRDECFGSMSCEVSEDEAG